jgi:hypothetical protein
VAVAHDQAVDGRNRHARHRRKRGDAFLVFMRLGEIQQCCFVQLAGVMQS